MADISKCGDDIDMRKAWVEALKKFIDTPDADDVECVPANLATTHPTMYDARFACTASHPLRQPAPPLPVRALTPSWRASPRRGGAHSRCLPVLVGLHVRMLRCVPFIQRQRGTLCLIHAFNNMLQHPRLHPSDMYSAFPLDKNYMATTTCMNSAVHCATSVHNT